MMKEKMGLKQGLALADRLVHAQLGRGMDTIERAIFECTWNNKSYATIKEEFGKSVSRIAHKASELWDAISKQLKKLQLLGKDEKVSKSNLQAVLERYQTYLNSLSPQTTSPTSIFLTRDASSITLPAQDFLELSENYIEFPQGAVPLNSSFYVERLAVESKCYEEIMQAGALLRIFAPRYMGKTSLMLRVLDRAAKLGYRNVLINFDLAESEETLSEPERFFKWFCALVGEALELPNRLEEYWNEIFGSKLNCNNYFKKYLLNQIEEPIILAIDRIDRIFPYTRTAESLFSLLRTWHEDAKMGHIWQKLRLILIYSTETYSISSIKQSPFNVGQEIELPEFTIEQVFNLAHQHRLEYDKTQIKELMNLIGGHPYLVRLALYHLAQTNLTISEFARLAPTDKGPYKNHLQQQLNNLNKQENLTRSFKKVLETKSSISLEAKEGFGLHSLGLVILDKNKVKIRCELYERYFKNNLS